MAAVTQPPQKRRWWLTGLVLAWILLIAGLAWRSARRDPPTVPEQRDIADALPVLERAAGAMTAAAIGDDRAVVLGDLRVSRDCSVTPIRAGAQAARDVTVYVRAGQALTVLKEIAAALPADFGAEAGSSSGGRRVGLRADAGGFVGIDAAADSGTQVLRLRASTGCRPLADGVRLDPTDPPAADPPDSLRRALAALGVAGSAQERAARVREVACPDGGTARTYTVEGVRAPPDLGRSLESVIEGATVVRAEPAGWAYRTGTDSVVIDRDELTVRVSATLACG